MGSGSPVPARRGRGDEKNGRQGDPAFSLSELHAEKTIAVARRGGRVKRNDLGHHTTLPFRPPLPFPSPQLPIHKNGAAVRRMLPGSVRTLARMKLMILTQS